ncbi:MAG: DUF3343 domain-containing protein [Eggerthellaceae bacterium]|nr:DUF3343 domain-containing protein [Eggerthellaceae bacterium]
MRQKRPYSVFSFKSNTDALAVEALGKSGKVSGRIIPLPSEISAGCGLAWRCDPDEAQGVIKELERAGLPYEGVAEVYLY